MDYLLKKSDISIHDEIMDTCSSLIIVENNSITLAGNSCFITNLGGRIMDFIVTTIVLSCPSQISQKVLGANPSLLPRRIN
ncbi:hypothetical protein Glove_217g28 [Diversispora epigaea]|uniref:Uncharacterized protein n=1 Tax=Diversispora epigaea TaxID=1348612 RepID=A0A397IGX4_9GLOM|nr:hypothetical protein Glove_217g28 [Diversispora epigaea]